MFRINKTVIFGVIGGLILLSFYFIILTLLNSFSHALNEFIRLWYLMLPLVIGFSIQLSLFFYLKEFRLKNTAMNSSMATTSGISTTSMIACCVHHVADVLPFLGLTAIALFLDKYQYF